MHDYKSVAQSGNKLIASRNSMSAPTELYAVNIADGAAEQITFTNKDLLDKITMGNVEERWMKTHDGEDMLTIIIYPPHFDNKKYSCVALLQRRPARPIEPEFPLSLELSNQWQRMII
ncbi:MAG: hypothetical protein R2750_12560 [Bacteroidales bacterium]